MGTWATVAIALAAGVFAYVQIRDGRSAREEESQPYVVVFMEASIVSEQIIDLVVKNLGRTAAHDVSLEVDPPLRRSLPGKQIEDVWLFDRLPVLVPGQEWRTWWDFGPNRLEVPELPDRHEVTVTFSSSKRPMEPLRYVLDWSAHKGRIFGEVLTTHDVAKALRKISKTLPKWQENIHGGVAVYVRDGDAKDERGREQRAEHLAKVEKRRRQAAGEAASVDEPPVPG
jgi:hypothetical protein